MKIIGTRQDDELWGTDDLIRGRDGSDTLEDYGAGNSRLYGDKGDDYLGATGGGFDRAYGGAGDDAIYVAGGEAWGGVGNDRVGANGLAVGGSGDDEVSGSGRLFGDEGPGLTQRVAGNDWLYADLGEGSAQMTGGLGGDVFSTHGIADGATGVAEVMDFAPGQDLLTASEWRGYYEGEGRGAALFAKLDANANGVLEWSDSLSGGAVYTDGSTMWLGLGATVAGPTATDAEDWLVVHGVAQVTAADWIMA